VPEISRFLGIVVRMHYRDHAPPHFHASYGEFRVVVQIETGIVDGRFPPRAMRHLLEWTILRQRELMERLGPRAIRPPSGTHSSLGMRC